MTGRGRGATDDAGRAALAVLQTGEIAVGCVDPRGAPEAARGLAERGVTAFSLELLPRISRIGSETSFLPYSDTPPNPRHPCSIGVLESLFLDALRRGRPLHLKY